MKRISVIFVSFCAILVTVILLSNNIKALSGDFSDLSNIKYENTMSYDEMLEYVEKTRTSEEIAEFKKLHPKIKLRTYAGERRFELWGGNIFTYDSKYKLQLRMDVELYYATANSKPKIVSLSGYHIYTGGGESCVFQGAINVHLIAGNAFYYSFNGDIYERGVIKWNLGGKIKIGEAGELNGSISNGDGFIRNVSESENFNSPLFEK